MFFQKMEGTAFDGAGGGDITSLSDWQAKIAATGADHIASISDITGSIRASVTGNTETANDVPYGGTEVIDMPQNIVFDLKYFSAATFAQLDQLRCWGLVRFWFLDNQNYVWGSTSTGNGVEFSSVLPATFGQAGIGTKNKATGNQVTWNNLCQPLPIAQLPFLATIDQTFNSGS